MEKEDFAMEQLSEREGAQVMEVNIDGASESQCEKDGAVQSDEGGSIGKFKDAEALMKAYNNLQAEFTRKCQRLSVLEKKAQEAEESAGAVESFIENNPKRVEEILKHYIAQVQKNVAPPLIHGEEGGITLMAPPKPKTLDEAREVVKNLFK